MSTRAERIQKLRDERARQARNEEWEGTLGKALTEALLRYLGACKPERVTPVERAISMTGYSDELKQLIVRSIETNPAMEETFLLIAELAYRDGEEAVREDWFIEDYR
jgi:hypothetical protein